MTIEKTDEQVKHPSAATLYLASVLFSALGNAVANVVWPWMVLQRTGDAATAAFVSTIIAIPSAIFAFVGGQLIDKFGRKRISVISDVISATSVVALILVDTSLEITVAWFIAIGIFGAIGDVPGMAARTALIGDISRRSGKSVDWLSGASQGVGGISFLVGPAIAGGMLALFDMTSILWITAACSGLAALLTLLIRLGASTDDSHAADKDFSLRAWREILSVRVIRLFLWTMLLMQILIAPFMLVLLPAHFEKINNPTAMGIAMSGFAVGMIIGSVFIARIGMDRRRLLWAYAIGLEAIAFFSIAWLNVTPIIIVGMFIAGISSGLGQPLVTVFITEKIPEHQRGRAFSIFSMIGLLASPVGLALSTGILQFSSIYQVAIILAVVGVIGMIGSIIMGFRVLEDRDPTESAPSA
ncbi:MAG: MFS transporter [Corynebacterium sp.]|nr:MFS transporter [Corynebacterium sp.]